MGQKLADRDRRVKAIILVGGKATRLLPLSVNTPKPLVPVMNVPILEHVIKHVARHGIEEIVLAQGHMAQSIEDYFGDGRRFGVKIYHSYESVPLGSAGAAKNAGKYLTDTFLVLNSDIFSDLDFTAMLDLHRRTGAKATIATTPVEDPTKYGLVESDNSGKVSRFLEKPKPEEVTTNMINAGAWFVEADVMAGVPENTNYSFERNVFPRLLSGGQSVYAFASSGYWIDMGTTEKYLQLHRDILNGKSKQYPLPGEKLIIGKESTFDTLVKASGRAVLGPHCHIESGVKLNGPVVMGEGCRVAEDAAIADSVLWRNVRVGRGAAVSGSIIADYCTLEDGCIVKDAVLGDGVTVCHGVRLPPGSKIDPGVRISPPE
jgi:mannose-1-phosphate guanylyltransferase